MIRCNIDGCEKALFLKVTDRNGRCIRELEYPFGACRRFRSVYALFDLLDERVLSGDLIKKGERLYVICVDIETGKEKVSIMAL